MTRSTPARTVVSGTLAAIVAVSWLLVPAGAPPSRAAAPALTLTSETRYDVLPEESRVKVTVALTATNHLVDTRTRRYYFDRAFLAVQPGATNFSIIARTGSPTVRVESAKADHTLLRIDFGGRLPAGSNRTFTLTFDIPDPGGVPTREVRIGSSLVTFPAWAYASESTPGGSVTVVFPAGYNVEVESPDLGEPTTDPAGNVVYSTGTLSAPLSFFAYFVADRPSTYREVSNQIEIDGRSLEVVVRSWPDDPEWATRVNDLMVRGLPVLSEAIGLPWLGEQPLVVEEAVSRSAAGYSGRYDPAAGRIEIAYYADSFVALHEAAHAWFDGSLLADRWATEGFASWYALQAAATLGIEVTGDPLTPELEAARIPLNAWDGPQPDGGNATADGETSPDDAEYAAALELARQVAERAGPDALTEIWASARQGLGAYQPAGAGVAGEAAALERGVPAPDWRGLLDLLEDRTGQSYGDLWRTWVVRPSETALLAERATTRALYESVRRRAGEWQLPRLIRDALRSWQFEQATELLDAADLALDDRDAVVTAARAAGLTVPGSLRAAFEGPRGFAAASAEADAQLHAIDAYQAAAASRLASPDLVETIGMWGTTPDVDLERAGTAFAAGELGPSVQASAVARSIWQEAREFGRNRVMSGLAAVAAVLLGMLLARRWVHDRSLRRRRRRPALPARGG